MGTKKIPHRKQTGAGSRNQNLRHTECWSRKEEENPFESQLEEQDPKDKDQGGTSIERRQRERNEQAGHSRAGLCSQALRRLSKKMPNSGQPGRPNEMMISCLKVKVKG